MTGISKHALDAKWRLFIPARLREDLGTPFHATVNSERCLCLYTDEDWTRLKEKVRALPRSQQSKARPLFAHAADCEPDSQGRILLPAELRNFANLEKSVAIVGCGDHVELWNADEWSKTDELETTPEHIADIYDELDF